MRQTLENLRTVLRSDGLMWFAETLTRDRNITFIFGTLDGYWRYEDTDLRTDHICMPGAKWCGVLEQSGFQWTRVFECYGSRHGIIVAQATKDRLFETQYTLPISKAAADEPPAPTPTWLLLMENDEPIADKLQTYLKKVKRRVVTVVQGDSFEAVNGSKDQYSMRVDQKSGIDQLVETVTGENCKIEGVIYAWALSTKEIDQAKISQPFIYLLQNVASQKHPPRVYALTKGIIPIGDFVCPNPSAGTVWGIAKTYRNEYSMNFCRVIDILPECDGDEDAFEIFHEFWMTELETRIIYRDRARHVARFVHAKIASEELLLPQLCDRFQLIHPESKQITDLEFGPLAPYQLEDNEVEVHVKASALNFKDVLNVLKPTEEFKDSNAVGFDFAGVVNAVGKNVTLRKVGDAVFGCNFTQGALPSHIKVPEDAVVPVPDDFTFCEAATLPAVFSTAYYCLMTIAKMKKGDTVLLHTASGGVGLSAIQIAKFVGANVIATAGSNRKRSYLRSIGIQHVFHSRNTNYEKQIMEVTNGRGVDIVLNSLTGPGFKEASTAVCAPNARFVEMSKLSIWSEEEFRERRPDVDYTIVDLTQLDHGTWKQLLVELKHHMSTGVMQPIPYVRFNSLNIRQALNYLQKARHIGKIVCVMPEIRVQDGKIEVITPLFNDRSSYLITGGLGGIGFEVAKWMVSQGAKHMILAGRSAPKPETAAVIQALNADGNHIVVCQADVGVKEQLEGILAMVKDPQNGLPPLRGVQHAAGVLHDAILANQTWEKFQACYWPKVRGSWNLHEATKDCRLEHFVLYSSMAALLGSPGQANHTASNCFKDALAVYRQSIGLPATTVNWGQWLEVGIATEIELPGVKALTNLQGVTALEAIMRSQRLQTAVMDFDSFGLACKLFPEFRTYLDEKVWKPSENNQASWNVKSEDFWEEVDAEGDREGKLTVIKKYIKILLRQALRLDPTEPIDDNANVQDMGVDSLMMVEMKNAVQNLVGSRFTVTAAALKDANTTQLLAERLMDLIEGQDATQLAKLSPDELQQLITEDSELPAQITAIGEAKRVSEIENILLTGATGNLAAYFLQQLSKLDSVKKIFCLVRTRGQQAVERLHGSIKEKGLDEHMNWAKVECVEGDITEPFFGLSETQYNQLANNVDAIVHSAVKADHTAHYRKSTKDRNDVRSVNVLGTINVLEFACHIRTKHVLHASTLLSVTTTNEDDGTLQEVWPKLSDFENVTHLGYPISKFVAELLVNQAVSRGIPCKSIRFPLILGDSQTGQFSMQNNHFMMRLFSFLKMKCMPSQPTPALVLPVDFCAKTAIQLFFNEQAPSDVYNVAPPRPQLEQEFSAVAEEMGYPVELVEYDDYIKKLKEDGEKSLLFIFKELYNDVDFVNSLYTSSSVDAVQKWLLDSDNFFVSKKMQKYYPEFFDQVEPSFDIIKRDLKYAEKVGLFGKFELVKTTDLKT